MKKSVAFLSFLLIIIFLVSSAFSSYDSNYAVYEPQPSWKNLKVLPQDISKDSLFGLMENYSISLGVKCSHCHISRKDDPTKLDFASDAKIEKEITRGMIVMTNEINENYFKPYFPDPKPARVYTADCVMCHRGTANPRKYLSNMEKMYELIKPEMKN